MEQHPESAAQLTANQRQTILEGRVDIGFDETMVFMALGHPDRIQQRKTADTDRLEWVYEAVRNDTAEVIHLDHIRYRGQRVRLQPGPVHTQQAYPHTTIVFEQGRVCEFTVQKRR